MGRTVSAGDAGLFAGADNEAELARCINELLDDPIQRQKMGRVGRDRVRKALAWEYSAPVLLAAYERVVSTGRARGAGRAPVMRRTSCGR